MLGTDHPTEAAPSATDQGTPSPEPDRTATRAFWVATVVAVLPVVVATTRAARGGWLPIGDNGYFAVRARDVLSEHHPLLGTWTSASLNADTDFNNPGPLLFDLLAPAAKLIDAGYGVAVGAALLNVLAIVGIGLVVRRRGGAVLGIVALATASALAWSMGSQLLFDPWQPHSLLLTFLLGLLLVWSLVCGDVRVLPWAVLVGSVIIQTHLSYGILLVALAAWGLVGLGLALRRHRRRRPDTWPAARRALVRSAAAAVVVGALCWSQPLVEQVRRGDDGNLARLATNATASSEITGLTAGLKITAATLSLPPFWLRPSFSDTLRIDRAGEVAGSAPLSWVGPPAELALASLLGLASLLALGLLDARRRDDQVSAGALTTAAVACAAALVTAVNLPLGPFGLPSHQFRWLWPVAAFTTLALVTALVRRSVATPRHERQAVRAFGLLTLVLAGANLPEHNVASGPSADEAAIPVAWDLRDQLGGLEEEGTLLLDIRGVRFAEPWSGWLIAELQRRGIPFVVDDDSMARQLGEGRRYEGGASQRIIVQEGDAAHALDGARRVAYVEGLSPQEQTELQRLRTSVVAHLEDLGRVPLNERGEAALRRPDQAHMAEVVAAVEADEAGAAELMVNPFLKFLVDHDLLALDEPWQERVERLAALQERWRHRTVGIFLAPVDPSATA